MIVVVARGNQQRGDIGAVDQQSQSRCALEDGRIRPYRAVLDPTQQAGHFGRVELGPCSDLDQRWPISPHCRDTSERRLVVVDEKIESF